MMMPGQPMGGAFESLKPLARGFATVAIAAVGMMLCATVGSLAYPIGGIGVIFGAVMGLLIFLFIGCCATGFWRDFCPSSSDVINMSTLLPGPLAVQVGGKGSVTMIMTVHEAKDVKVQGQMPWSLPDLYVEVSCGKNPTHNTCVKQNGKWSEQMKLEIGALDQTILLKIKNQDLFGSSDVGYVCVDVIKNILEPDPPGKHLSAGETAAPFPRKRAFDIEAGQGDYLRFGTVKPVLVLSFAHADLHNQLQESKRKDIALTAAKGYTANTTYGSLDSRAAQYIATMQFNPDMAPPVANV